jgi:hypothetical protein
MVDKQGAHPFLTACPGTIPPFGVRELHSEPVDRSRFIGSSIGADVGLVTLVVADE